MTAARPGLRRVTAPVAFAAQRVRRRTKARHSSSQVSRSPPPCWPARSPSVWQSRTRACSGAGAAEARKPVRLCDRRDRPQASALPLADHEPSDDRAPEAARNAPSVHPARGGSDELVPIAVTDDVPGLARVFEGRLPRRCGRDCELLAINYPGPDRERRRTPLLHGRNGDAQTSGLLEFGGIPGFYIADGIHSSRFPPRSFRVASGRSSGPSRSGRDPFTRGQSTPLRKPSSVPVRASRPTSRRSRSVTRRKSPRPSRSCVQPNVPSAPRSHDFSSSRVRGSPYCSPSS